MKTVKNSITIALLILLFSASYVPNRYDQKKHEKSDNTDKPNDISNKLNESGLTQKQIEGILASILDKGGGSIPSPEAIQERFFTGQAANDQLGYSVSNAGDVNGDGYDDVVVGAPGYSSSRGRAYIYFGGSVFNSVADVILTGEANADFFGWSVSTAGDVNGDGYDDVIVGAFGNDASGTDAGRAYIYYGGSPMNNTADVIMTRGAAGDYFGASVSVAGDVNGDGYSDVIVSAQNNDAGGTDAGRAYIYYGGANMNNTADVILTGAAAGDNFGYSVSTAGDVNGDGYSDVIVGAPFNDAIGTDAGRAYIYFGGSPMNDVADVTLSNSASGNLFGRAVSTAGDVNGDGYSDVIVGSPYDDIGSFGTDAGSARIYFGAADMNNPASINLTGFIAGDLFGSSVSAAGDINGDGYSDVIVGAPFNDAGGSNAGRAYIYWGGTNMDSTADAILTGAASDDRFGNSVSSAGDFNGDGYADVIVGAPRNDAGGSNAGRAYLYTNSLTGADILDEFFTGAAAGDNLGISVSTAGDVNGDGYSDLIVGAQGNDAGGTDAGRAYIYYGGPNFNNTPNVILTGAAANNFFGSSVSTAGDVNGDGYDDVIVGASRNSAGGSDAGRAYIYFGGNPMNNVADVIITGAVGDLLGRSVSTAGDVNGDGYSDVIIGAPFTGGFGPGRAYIYFGGNPMNNVVDVTLTGVSSWISFGSSVSTAGDVNGDGYSDVIVGAPEHDPQRGRAYVYFGAANMDNNADVVFYGETSENLGLSVSTAGDVNGDGYSDIIVGAPSSPTLVGSTGGKAHIYFGGVQLDHIPDITLIGGNVSDDFGSSVFAAGDVNGDGYSDVIVGARYNDVGGTDAGQAYIFFGGVSMDNKIDVIMTGAAANDLFGKVSVAGDINGDGFDDVIVGALRNDAGGTDAGRAYLYLSSAPPVKPRIMSVKDVPNDQGGYVRVRWNRSAYDIPGQNRISEYILQRSDPPGQSGFVWDYVASIPAMRELQYSYVAPTPSDSFSNSSGTVYFRVVARGLNPDERWYSNIMYGHSVDNLSPAAPREFYATVLTGDVKLGWKANTEPDLYNYVIYRTDYPDANPDTLTIYAQSIDTTFIDTNPLTGTAYYYLRAQDVHNNLSPAVSTSSSASTAFALSVTVVNGWNMVSAPGQHPVNQNVDTWWQYRDPAANVFRYAGSYLAVAEVTSGTGYWMKHSGVRIYNTGDEWPMINIVPNNPIAVSSGWNLIGGYEYPAQVSGITTTPPGLISGPIFGYSGSYYVTANLEPGYGYWIKLSAPGQINIPNTMLKSESEVVNLFNNDWGRIIITDASGISFTLYSVEGQVDLNKYELPPLPPSGMFDVRYTSGRMAEDISTGSQLIQMSGIEYPVTVRVENINISLTDESGKVINSQIKSGEEITITDNSIHKLKVISTDILKPTEYLLEQNYPNPFNPSTKIRFVIPNEVRNLKDFSSQTPRNDNTLVTLKVYDILGNEIATLVNEYKPAGIYEVIFEAGGLSSGVYFYELRTSQFSSVKKMILLR